MLILFNNKKIWESRLNSIHENRTGLGEGSKTNSKSNLRKPKIRQWPLKRGLYIINIVDLQFAWFVSLLIYQLQFTNTLHFKQRKLEYFTTAIFLPNHQQFKWDTYSPVIWIWINFILQDLDNFSAFCIVKK